MTLATPQSFPLARDGGRVGMVELDEAAYDAASFLDGRLDPTGARTRWEPWAPVAAVAPAPRRAHFLFHIGHCGSTLLSRLLGQHPDLFALREPALLRDLAEGKLSPSEIDPLLGLYTRVWRPRQTALIKATSFVSEIGADLIARTQGRALLLGVTPPVYFRSILAGPNSRREAVALADGRRVRLEARLGRPVVAAGEGEALAMSWLSEAMALRAVAAADPARVLQLDFEVFLAAPGAGLRACLAHLQLDPADTDVDALARGPIMKQYAKAPDQPYDAALRAALLAQAARETPGQVGEAMDWLQRQARSDGRVAEVLQDFARIARPPLAHTPAPV